MYLKQEGGIESGKKILGKPVLGDGRLEVWERRRDLMEGYISVALRFSRLWVKPEAPSRNGGELSLRGWWSYAYGGEGSSYPGVEPPLAVLCAKGAG